MRKQQLLIKNISLSLVILFVGVACERKPIQRKYIEINLTSVSDLAVKLDDDNRGLLPSMPDDETHAQFKLSKKSVTAVQSPISQIQWKTPKGWGEEQGSGLRIATFYLMDSREAFDCSIVALGLEASALEPNVIRWMRQINLPMLDKDAFDKFISNQEQFLSKGKNRGILIDFSELQKDDDHLAPSMLAAIITTDTRTIFVKLTSSKASISNHKEQFRSLCLSIDVK